MSKRLNEIIQEGDSFSFDNNSSTSYDSIFGHREFGKASPELLAWIADVEDYILENYGEGSSPYKLVFSADKEKLTGHYKSDFERELGKIKAAISSCKRIQPKPKKKDEESNLIIALFKNGYFWAALVPIAVGSFTLGSLVASSKFDIEKNELYEENKQLKIKLSEEQKEGAKKDSLIKAANLVNQKEVVDIDSIGAIARDSLVLTVIK